MFYFIQLTRHSTLNFTHIYFLPKKKCSLDLKKNNPSRVARESFLLCFFSQFYPLTTAEKSIRAPCFAVFVSHVMSKIAQELWTVSKWCISDQKLNDSSMNRTRPVPAKPSCWNPGTRIGESSSPSGPGPVHCWPSPALTSPASQGTHRPLWPILHCQDHWDATWMEATKSSHWWETSSAVSLPGIQLSLSSQPLLGCQSLNNEIHWRRNGL